MKVSDINIDTSPYEKANSKDKNINIVIFKNIKEDCEVNYSDYLNLIKDNNILKPDYTNININIIIVENIISNEEIKLQNKVENISLEEEELLLQTGNNNINLMIIKNIIPLQDIQMI